MISVVIPVFNGADVLPTTVAAVRSLAGVSEVVWVDDGSTDETATILDSVTESTATCIRLPSNRGRSAARNAGVAATAGDVVVFFDADVEPDPETATALAVAATRSGAVAAVARLAPVVTRPDEPYQDYVAHHPRGPAPHASYDAPLDWRYFLAGASAIRRSALDAAGGFPEDVPYGEDQALACRLAQAHPGGLRLAPTTVRLHDLGDLVRAVGHAREFGASVAQSGSCDDGPLAGLRRRRALAPVAAAAAPALGALVRRLPAGAVRRKAVRYLLGSTALAATRRV